MEQTVAGNARLEQELMVLRQKLQQQQLNGSQQHLNAGSSSDLGSIDARTAADATALLEDGIYQSLKNSFYVHIFFYLFDKK